MLKTVLFTGRSWLQRGGVGIVTIGAFCIVAQGGGTPVPLSVAEGRICCAADACRGLSSGFIGNAKGGSKMHEKECSKQNGGLPISAGICRGTAGLKPHLAAQIKDAARYEALNPWFKKAFDFLRRPDLSSLDVGRCEIDGSNCWAMIQEATLVPLAERKIESHRKYIDIQAPITGPETIGLCEMTHEQLAIPFNEKDDYVLFDGESKPVTLQPGEFAIFFPPNGAHAPGCRAVGGPEKIRKIVIKVRAE